MRLLLDTHVFLWLLNGDKRLSSALKGLLFDPDNDVSLSVASMWESAIKIGRGRLQVPGGSVAEMYLRASALRIGIVPIRLAHLKHLETLPMLHKDPFDRVIFCQSEVEGMRLVSDDERMLEYAPGAIR